MVNLLFSLVCRRFYSNNEHIVLRCDLSAVVNVPDPAISLRLRELCKEDVPKLLDIWKPGLSTDDIWERIRIRYMFKTGIKTPYVTVTDDDYPCHLAWSIDSEENEKLQRFYHGQIPPLPSDEVLIECVFTLEEYRGLGISPWRSKKMMDKNAQRGAKRSLCFIKKNNYSSLKAAAKNAYEPYMIKIVRWRLFRSKTELHLNLSTFL